MRHFTRGDWAGLSRFALQAGGVNCEHRPEGRRSSARVVDWAVVLACGARPGAPPFRAVLISFTHRMRAVGALVMLLLLSAGCSLLPGGGASELVLRGRGAGEAEAGDGSAVGRFETAVYARHSADEATFVLWDGEGDGLQQAAVVRVLWRPRAGRTPLGSDATNATLTYVVLPAEGGDGEGRGAIWTGGGFVRLRGKPGDETLGGSVWSGDLSPVVAIKGEGDDAAEGGGVPRRATLRGSFTAVRDDARALGMLRRLDRIASRRLGTPVMVRGE